MSCAALSISLFALRGGLQLGGVVWRRAPALRVTPHLIDTLLLASALWLAWASRQYPFVQGWLTAKVIALCGYIALGKLALAADTPRAWRGAAFAGALAMVTYIVGTAFTHSPTWGLG